MFFKKRFKPQKRIKNFDQRSEVFSALQSDIHLPQEPRVAINKKTKRKLRLNKKKAFIFILILLIILIGVITFLLFKSSLLRIRSVSFKNEVSCVTKEQIMTDLKLTSEMVFFLNESEKEKRLKERYLCLKKVIFYKDFPDKVEIELEERTPFLALGKVELAAKIDLPDQVEATPSTEAAFYNIDFEVDESSSSAVFIVDKEGFIFDEYRGDKKIQFVYVSGVDLKLGKKVDGEAVDRIRLVLNKLSELSISFKKLKLIGNNFISDGDTKLIFAFDRDLNRQLASLQLINQKAKINSRSLERIDLRFERPVVIYTSKK